MTNFIARILVGVTLFALTGCLKLQKSNSTIYYQAKTPTAVRALNSRIEALREVLRNDARFTQSTERETLGFVGVEHSEFEGCWIGYNRAENDGNKDGYAVMVVSTPRQFRYAKQVRDLRHLIDQTLGPETVKQLSISFEANHFDMR